MKTVGILIFDDVELATFADAAALFLARDPVNEHSPALFKSVLVAQSRRLVTCDTGVQIRPQATLTDHPHLDYLLVPGGHGSGWEWPDSRIMDVAEVLMKPDGKGVRRERLKPAVVNWIREQSLRVEAVIGICSGAVLLAEAGVLQGCQATIHPRIFSWMHRHYPDLILTPEEMLVDAGRVMTARGWKAAFLAALRMIVRSYGVTAAIGAASMLDPCGTCVMPALLPMAECSRLE